MIELFEELLTGIAAAALCGGAAVMFAKGKAMQEVLRLATGLAILLAVLRPLSEFRLPNVFERTAQQTAPVQYSQQTRNALAEAAARQVEAYVEQRAQQMGISCTATLQLAHQAEKTLVTGVQLTCSRNADTHALSQMLVSECGIPKELQTWNWTDSGSN